MWDEKSKSGVFNLLGHAPHQVCLISLAPPQHKYPLKLLRQQSNFILLFLYWCTFDIYFTVYIHLKQPTGLKGILVKTGSHWCSPAVWEGYLFLSVWSITAHEYRIEMSWAWMAEKITLMFKLTRLKTRENDLIVRIVLGAKVTDRGAETHVKRV